MTTCGCARCGWAARRGLARGPREWGCKCTAGSIGPILAVLLSIIALTAGAAVDVGRWLQASSQLQKAQSAAAMAGMRMLQITGDRSRAIASARKAFEQNLGSGADVQLEGLTFDVGADGASFTVQSSGSTPTTLLRIAGIDSLGIRSPAATAAAGGRSGLERTSFEIAIALDLSDAVGAAMLAQIKLAVTDLVDIVAAPHQLEETARIALIPFTDTIDPGLGIGRFTGELRQGVCETPGCQRLAFQVRRTCGGAGPACQQRILIAARCVAERTEIEPFSDASPLYAPIPVAYPLTPGRCDAGGNVEPLTPDVDALRRSIAGLSTGRGSSPQLGMAWAWYALSPEWAYLWPAASRPAAYAELGSRQSGNRPKLRKIAVMVQSASDTVQHCQGVDDRIIACNSPNGTAIQQTQRLCDAMRRSGIAIYVVGIGVDGNRHLDAVLRNNCAGREDSFYAVRSGSELRQAFRDIALQITPAVETQ